MRLKNPSKLLENQYRGFILLILILSFGLRVFETTKRSLWFDEAVEFLTANMPLSALPQNIIRLNYQPPLHSYLLHFWIKIDLIPLLLRLLPALITLLTLTCIIVTSRLLFGQRVASLGGLVPAGLPTER